MGRLGPPTPAKSLYELRDHSIPLERDADLPGPHVLDPTLLLVWPPSSTLRHLRVVGGGADYEKGEPLRHRQLDHVRHLGEACAGHQGDDGAVYVISVSK